MKTVTKYFPLFLFCYHLLFAYLAWHWVVTHHGDAQRYWFVAENVEHRSWVEFLQPGTDLIKWFTFPLVRYLHLPFFGGFIIFSSFSFIGFYKLWQVLKTAAAEDWRLQTLAMLLLLLPNLHLWTSFIGKEAILFVALVVLTQHLVSQNFRSISFVVAFLVLAIIRPHVAIVIFAAFIIALLWKGKRSPMQSGAVVLGSLLGFFGLYLLLKKVAMLPAHPIEKIIRLYNVHIQVLRNTQAYVPLDQYPLPYKIFTFYFRPLPFEKSGVWYWCWSLENAVLLSIVVVTVFLSIRSFKKVTFDFYAVFAVFVLLLFAVLYVYAYANYGLIARTKIMVMPFLYLLLLRILNKLLPTKTFHTNKE